MMNIQDLQDLQARCRQAVLNGWKIAHAGLYATALAEEAGPVSSSLIKGSAPHLLAVVEAALAFRANGGVVAPSVKVEPVEEPPAPVEDVLIMNPIETTEEAALTEAVLPKEEDPVVETTTAEEAPVEDIKIATSESAPSVEETLTAEAPEPPVEETTAEEEEIQEEEEESPSADEKSSAQIPTLAPPAKNKKKKRGQNSNS